MRYLHYDVFTDQPLTGNQLAVFLDVPAGITGTVMQQIAAEMAFPETTFVFAADSAGTDARVRIFTPATELPMAGHPTIGTTFALAHAGRLTSARRSATLGLGIGPTRVDLEWDASELRFVWMTQAVPQFGDVIPHQNGVAAALRLTPSDVCATLPVQPLSSGVPFLYVPLVSRRAVDACTVDSGRLDALWQSAGMDPLPLFVFTPEQGGDDATVYSRMFAPSLGIAEDPATGGASGPLGAYLVRHGIVAPDAARGIVSLQGVRMGRPSRIHIAIGVRGSEIHDVRVGGAAVLAGEGTLHV
jgi:trans-2,3-dihydro-3-hydroxyanthranilate isomerase